MATLVGLLTVNHMWHAVAIAFSVAATFWERVGRIFIGSCYSIIGWVLGVVAVWLLWRWRVDGLYAAVFAGVRPPCSPASWTSPCSRSVAPFAGPMWVDRVTTAVSLGPGAGVAVGAALAIRRMPGAGWAGGEEAEDAERVERDAAPD
jgi:hypothetical protein